MELLIVIAIIGILAAVGVPMYTGYQNQTKVAVARSNHATLVRFASAQAFSCSSGIDVTLKNKGGQDYNLNCSTSTVTLTQFVAALNEHVYGDFRNPFPPVSGSRCRPNVDNCDPPGYLTGCVSTAPDRFGMMSIIAQGTSIRVCTNVGPQPKDPSKGEVLDSTISFGG